MELPNHDPEPSESENTDQHIPPKVPKKVRGSGFTYDEEKERTDQTIPLDDKNASEVNELPNLGKRNRP